jgi:hypothetical protein
LIAKLTNPRKVRYTYAALAGHDHTGSPDSGELSVAAISR